MISILLWAALGLVCGTVSTSFFEWLLHKYVMHRPVGKFRYAFNAHAVVHHQTFKADHSYHLHHEKDKETIPMAWWNGPVLVVIGSIPFGALALLIGQPAMAIGVVLAVAGYYGFYEYIHWCMHLPRNRRVEQPKWFRRLNGHHLLHHRYMHKNFNVVLPLADVILGTFLARSKVPFLQARGPAVPDVQPPAAAVQREVATV